MNVHWPLSRGVLAGTPRFVLRAGLIALLAGVAATGASHCAYAQDAYTIHRDEIQGRITDSAGTAVPNATVTITMAPDRSFQQTSTDADGHYRITFARGTGDYLVHAIARGKPAARRRVTRTGSDSLFVVDLQLRPPPGPPQLAAVMVRAQKPTPRRGSDFSFLPGPGADERLAQGVTGAVAPELAGNLSAIAATVPGLTLTPNGVSAGGIAPSGNSATLNGLSFAGTDVPRDAVTQIRVSSSTYDPSRGWFGGVQEQVDLAPDVVSSIRSGHLTLDAPALQYTNALSRALGGRFTGISASVGGADRMDRDELTYNYGVAVSRRTDRPVSLLTAPNDVLAASGVSADSIMRLRAILPATGLGAVLPASDISQTTDRITFVGQIGKAPSSWTTFKTAKTVWALVASGDIGSERALGLNANSTPASRLTATDASGSLQAHLSSYARDNVLIEGRTGVSLSHHRTRPAVTLPGATVLLLSDAPGETSPSAAPVSVAGDPAGGAATSSWSWETAADMKWYPQRQPAHRLKLSADARLDGASTSFGQSLGDFTFLSLGDLASGQAASFTRTLNAQVQRSRVANAFVALGDWWRATDGLDVLYGLRAEGTRYLDAPERNPGILAAFGRRTDALPGGVGLSPRVGFTWTHAASRPGGYTGGALGKFYRLPTGTLRGGIGEFRSFLAPQLVEGALEQTGLPGGPATLICVGAGVPQVDWAAFAQDAASIPSVCATGARPMASDASPGVEFFAPNYRAPRSWKGNLNFTSRVARVVYTVDGLYSLNLDQPGRMDLNFSNAARFVTAGEGRPVYTAPTDIIPATGLPEPGAARLVPNFGHVFENVSTNRSVGRQVSLTLSPDLDAVQHWFASGSYTLADVRQRASGFDGTTFGSPANREWARSNFDVRHQFMLQGGYSTRHYAVTLFGRVQSGLPFTPIVGSDVNGDGLLNDRAFVFDPTTADPTVAAGLRSLLANATGSTRECLRRQLGHPPAENSCDGPWTAFTTAQVTYHGVLPFGGGRSGTIGLFFNNPLGGLDQLVHGPNHLHGWGGFAAPDPVLYTVRGFDPATQRFQYTVNSRFGDPRPTAGLRSPFRITLDVSVDLSADAYRGFLNRWVRPGRDGYPGARLPALMIKLAYSRIIFDPYRAILEQSDSLMLTRAQVDSLHAAQRVYLAERDSVLSALASYLAGLGDKYDAGEALRRQRETLDRATEIGHMSIRHALPGLLDPLQLRMLPFPANRLYAAPDNVHGMAALQP